MDKGESLSELKEQKIISITRKSSSVNARGIPTAAYPMGGTWGGAPPGQVRQGYSRWDATPARSDRGVPEVGYPHQGTPPAGPGWGTYPPPGPGRGTHLGVDRQMDGFMDRHVWKHYLPVVLRTRSVTRICI